MDYTISVVPPGGGEQDYRITIRGAPFVPRPGEYIVVRGDDPEGEGVASAFKIRYATTYAQRIEGTGDARTDEVVVEVEPIIYPGQTSAHRRTIEMYQARGKTAEEYPASGY